MSRLSSLKAQIISYFDLDPSYPSSPLELSESDNSSAVAGSRKIFVQCTQYFLTTGTLKLLQLVEETCKDVSSTLLLTDQVNSDRMREVFEAADQIISKKVPTFFSALVAPLTESEKCSSDPVMQLLTRLVKSLESEKCRETLSTLIDFYLTAAVHKLPSEPAALAKLLPSFLDIFDFVASDAYDSPLQNSLCSSDIYHYANFATAYGTCVSNQAERITKDACADEFSKLLDCVKSRVLVDGTFCNAALANKINLREQLPKYLGGDVDIVTTKCVLAELERLGSPVYGALVICRQFVVDMCPHTPHRSPAECLAHLARRATKGIRSTLLPPIKSTINQGCEQAG
ncbi:hypothetical protein NECAME_13920 [Necator americanus]|uniref:Uncharacterized protein n=1 Tax=Necator americanus TaxID=51031 RepID=W2SRL8_NECAM|nr:hypothetical protein NECAME_13920 [Necator americanus]ETN72250.1 hypothetical protein NECAME_13920 [Necator americanus]